MLSSRPAHLFTDGRMTAKTPGRENTIHRGPTTVHGKGKQNSVAPVQPNSVQPQRTVKDGFPSKNPIRLATRPLGDKTPFPNRDAPNKFNTPLPGDQKIARLVLTETHKHQLLHLNATPDSVARPSSTRKHVRVPRSASKSFQTPLMNGNPWDVSDLEIVVPLAEEPVAAETDDFDEIEYMPPNSLDTPYTPSFDFVLPDYKEVGAGLRRLAHSYPYNDTPPLELEPEVCACDMPEFSFPALPSDDPFLDARAPPRAMPPAAKQPPSRPGTSSTKQSITRPAVARPAAATRKPLPNGARPPVSKRPPVSAPLKTAARPHPSSSTTRAATKRPLVGAAKRPPTRTGVDSVAALVRPDPAVEEDFVFDV
ncbi:hypothetical protein DFH07DRAFT_916677 [Mycena maculata]|uniref:Uncharacterized protein n=1 Tax=Mycena maculata TaxID=230809 RepID=A0AAD7JHR9_9AGAR|nr:hypothetical protein DFH07DRAFT_916677 [Mycena maculata]